MFFDTQCFYINHQCKNIDNNLPIVNAKFPEKLSYNIFSSYGIHIIKDDKIINSEKRRSIAKSTAEARKRS